MKTSTWAITALLTLFATTPHGKVLRGTITHDDSTLKNVDCQLFKVTGIDVDNPQDDMTSWQCLVENDGSRGNTTRRIPVVLPDNWLGDHHHQDHTPMVRLTETVFNKATGAWHVSNVTVFPTKTTAPSRRLAAFSGTKKAVAIRVVTTSGQQPESSLQNLQGKLMGLGPTALENTFRSQFNKCSMGAMDIQPATAADGRGIVNGVAEVTVPLRIDSGCNILGSCQEEIRRQTEMQLGRKLTDFDFVLFCLPDGSRFGENGSTNWAAFAYTGGHSQWFQRDLCKSMTTVMHETGHNLGFGHSNEGGVIREDKSDMLGKSIIATNGPEYCFNGQKFSLTGWLWNRQHMVDVMESSATSAVWTGRLVAFVDHQDPSLLPTDCTLVRVVLPGDMDLYVVYNRAKSFNQGVREKGNQVTIVQSDSKNPSISNMLKGLTPGTSHSVAGVTVTYCRAEVQGQVDSVILSVYRDGQSRGSCELAAGSPSVAIPASNPTPSPVVVRTRAPTPAPSPAPTQEISPRSRAPTKVIVQKPSPSLGGAPVTIVQNQPPQQQQQPGQCTAPGTKCFRYDECCGDQVCSIPRRFPIFFSFSKSCCLSRSSYCSSNSECCSGRCRTRFNKCY